MKALVLCAGRGTRLRPLTHTRAKAALPVAGRPVLVHILEYLRTQGFVDVGVVISPRQSELKRLVPADVGLNLTFIRQRHPQGIAHAVQAARDYLGDEPFLLYLGDNLTGENLAPARRRFERSGAAAVVAVRPVDDPRRFGVAQLNGDRITAVAEKPAQPTSNLAIAGIYFFTPAIHAAINGLRPSARGELEITDAIAQMIAAGDYVVAHEMTSWWQDMGSPEGMLIANRRLLAGLVPYIAGELDMDSVIVNGPVQIGPGVQMRRVNLNGPVSIAAGAVLRDCVIGPFTSVGEGSLIENAAIEDSIVMSGCRLTGPAFRLSGCLLGRGVVVEAVADVTTGLVVGDDGHVRLPTGPRPRAAPGPQTEGG